MQNRWGDGPGPGATHLDGLVYLSNRVGDDLRLVQPGGGNSSVKVAGKDGGGDASDTVLLVKGSGTDLRSIGATGFTALSMARLQRLRETQEMTDEEMMEFMSSCMLRPHRQPLPSVETPLHAVLPHRVILHTHDVVTMSLTNVAEKLAGDAVQEAFGGQVVHVPYVRPGFPLARAVAVLAPDIPPSAAGLSLAHHGLVVWAETPEDCYRQLVALMKGAEQFIEQRRSAARGQGRPAAGGPDRSVAASMSVSKRRRCAEVLLPIIRGQLGRQERVILEWDAADSLLSDLQRPGLMGLAARGVTTPEYILRAGRLPIWLETAAETADLDTESGRQALAKAATEGIEAARSSYLEYHRRHAPASLEPAVDWAKVVLMPGVGMVTAFKDRKNARVAAACYRAALESMQNAEALGGFEFIPESEVFTFEHWPLERRKVDEAIIKERKSLLLPRHVALIMGAGSGIGEASAWRFAEEGAHVVLGDLDGAAARSVAAAIEARLPGRAVAVDLDVRDESSIAAAVSAAVLEFGGLDALFYTAGLAPRFAPLLEIKKEDLEAQLAVHYTGALLAMGAAGRVMRRQGLGGSIICSVSKAALAPGREAAAYGGSKAALQHALRVAAVEFGEFGIRVNAINADQVDTPLFRSFAAARAQAQGRTLEEQLEGYRQRNVLGASLIPPRAVAELAVLLASQRFAYTTGDILTVDGGLPEAFPR